MQEIKFEAGLRLQSLREHAVHLEGKNKLTLRESSVVLPARRSELCHETKRDVVHGVRKSK